MTIGSSRSASRRVCWRARARHGEALEAFTAALEAASNSIDELVCGELWMNRGVLYGWAGEIEAAENDTRNGLDVFERLGHTKRAADLRHNLAWLAGRRGDLVEAFRRFDEAERQYDQVGLSSAAIFPDRSEVLLAAGLSREALTLAERAVDDLRAAGDDVDVAEASILVARAALLVGDPQRAADASALASELFARQDRGGWWAAAASLHVESRLRAGIADDQDVRRIDDVISAAAGSGLGAASAEARVVAAELAADRRDWTSLQRHLEVLDQADLGLAAGAGAAWSVSACSPRRIEPAKRSPSAGGPSTSSARWQRHWAEPSCGRTSCCT